MEISLFDSNCLLGPSFLPQPGAPYDVHALLACMDGLGIQDALVTSSLGVYYDPLTGNEALLNEVAESPRLHPCAVMMPEYLLAQTRQTVRRMAKSGYRAARLLPKRGGPLREWNYRELLGALCNERIPVLIDFELEHYGSQMQAIDWDGLNWALGEFPDLPVVLLRAGLALERTLLPLMKRHGNLHIETSYYIGTGALERLCECSGTERLLFGTGMPRFAPGPAITLLTYSGLSDAQKHDIGGDNLRRLLRYETSAKVEREKAA